jgi:hypothetical protein
MASLQESVICSLNFGKGCCFASTNTILGYTAGGLYTTSSANNNSAIGFGAGRGTTARNKVSLGYKAGFLSYGGSNNVLVGSLVGAANYFGSDSVIIGQNAGYFTQYGSVGIGAGALRTGTNSSSVGIGTLAICNSGNKTTMTAIGNGAGFTNTGANTVFVGDLAGGSAGGGGSVAVGACAGRFGTNTNTTQIGFYAYDGNYNSNRFVIGKYGHTSAYIYVAWSNVSDSRDKSDVDNLPNNLGLNFIRKLRPVSFKFDFRREYMYKCGCEFGEKDGTLKRTETNYGFLAQQIEESAQELNVKFDGVSYDEYNDGYTLKTLELLSPIVKAIQELNNELDIIEQKII